jgi:hypothetical protein
MNITELLALKATKMVLGGLAGGLVGAGSGLLVNYGVKAVAEGIALKKAKEELLEENGADAVDPEDEWVNDVDAEAPVVKTPVTARIRRAGKQALKDYTSYSKPVAVSPEIVEVAEQYLEDTEPAGPVLIDEETWRTDPDPDGEDWLDKSFTYWVGDGVLSDDGHADQPVVIDPVEKIGEEAMKFKGWVNGKLFVRNEKIRTDFTIVRVDMSYAEVILGELPAAKPKPTRKGSARVQRSAE